MMLHEVNNTYAIIICFTIEIINVLALEYTPSDQKSLYRRANAFERLGKLNEAICDAQRLITMTPKEGSTDEQTNILLRKLRESAQNKVHRYMSNIFSRFLMHVSCQISTCNVHN
jgi:two-component SAPR family response regulator